MQKKMFQVFSATLLIFYLIACQTTQFVPGDKKMQLANLTKDNTPNRPGNRFDSVHEQCQTNLLSANQLLDQILVHQGERDLLNTLMPFNELQIHLDSASSLAGLLAEVHPEKVIRDKAESCTQQVQRFVTELSLNRHLYEALTAVRSENLDEESKRMLAKTLLNFRRSGVDKDDRVREKIKKIEEELVLIGQDFNRNIREDVLHIQFKGMGKCVSRRIIQIIFLFSCTQKMAICVRNYGKSITNEATQKISPC
jgi:hypothetical protein